MVRHESVELIHSCSEDGEVWIGVGDDGYNRTNHVAPQQRAADNNERDDNLFLRVECRGSAFRRGKSGAAGRFVLRRLIQGLPPSLYDQS